MKRALIGLAVALFGAGAHAQNNFGITMGGVLPTYTSPADRPISIAWPAGAQGGAPIISAGCPIFSGVCDPSIYIGINQDQRGVLIDPTQPGVALGLENNWNDGSACNKQEAYLQSVFTDLTTLRPLFFQVDPCTHKVTYAIIRAGDFASGTGLEVRTPDNALSYRLLPSVFTMSGLVGRDTLVNIRAAAGQNAIVALGRNATDGYVTFGVYGDNVARVRVNSLDTAYFWAVSQGVAAAAFSVGESNNAAAGFFRAGRDVQRAVIAKANSAGQTANLYEGQTSAGATVYAVSPSGALTTSPTTTALLDACFAGSDGKRAFVTDSIIPLYSSIGLALIGGGTYHTPVICDSNGDGTGIPVWRIG